MKRILFACDLDNTLIHSSRKRLDDDICVEWIDDKPQSFMSSDAASLLHKICAMPDIVFLPVTTRSIGQYLRIQWPVGCCPYEALVSNGAIYLRDSEVEPVWRENSFQNANLYRMEFDRLYKQCIADSRFTNVRMIDGMFLFVCCADAETLNSCMPEYISVYPLKTEWSGRKMYFFPPSVNKGTAVERYCQRNIFDFVIAAGDSMIDVPMLEMADLALMREKLKLTHDKFCYCDNAEHVLKGVVDILQKL